MGTYPPLAERVEANIPFPGTRIQGYFSEIQWKFDIESEGNSSPSEALSCESHAKARSAALISERTPLGTTCFVVCSCSAQTWDRFVSLAIIHAAGIPRRAVNFSDSPAEIHHASRPNKTLRPYGLIPAETRKTEPCPPGDARLSLPLSDSKSSSSCCLLVRGLPPSTR